MRLLDFQIFLKIAKRFDPLGRALHLYAVKGIAFVQAEFATDNLVHCVGVAVDVDPFDKHTRCFCNVKGYAHRQSVFVTLKLRIDVCKRIAEQSGGFSQPFDGILNPFRIVPIASLHRQVFGQCLGFEIANFTVNFNFAKFVPLTFFDHVRDDEIFFVRR